MEIRLDDAHVLVVGGSAGIGLATARAAADARARVTLAGRSSERLEWARGEIRRPVDTRVLDVNDEGSVASALDSVDRIDHLVLSYSSGRTGPFPEATVAEARPYLDTVLWGAYRVARAAADKIAPAGSVTFLSGTHGQKPGSDWPTVTVTKAAVDALARSLAVELSPVRVNAVAPGPVATSLWRRLARGDQERADRMLERAGERTLVGRPGRPEEIAHAILFLMTNELVTGTVLVVDGGDLVARGRV